MADNSGKDEFKPSFTQSILNNNFITIIVVVTLLVITILSGILFVLKSPEYALYSSIQAIRTHNYEKAKYYVNIDQIAENRVNEAKKELLNMPEIKNNPFAGFAIVMFEGMANQLVNVIKVSFKGIVLSPDNRFTEISNLKLITFLTVKEFEDIKLDKYYITTEKVWFELTKNKQIIAQILLTKNNRTWQIVDVVGYPFWTYYQEREQMKDYYRSAAKQTTKEVNQAFMLALALQDKDITGMNSKQLTDFFAERFIVVNKLGENKIELNNGVVLEFIGNGKCEKGGCKIIVDLDGADGENKKWTKADSPADIVELNLVKDQAIPPEFVNCLNNDYVNCN